VVEFGSPKHKVLWTELDQVLNEQHVMEPWFKYRSKLQETQCTCYLILRSV